MLKKIFVIGIVSSLYLTSGFSKELTTGFQTAQKSNKFKIDELAFLPHPGKLIKQGKVVLSLEQKQRLNKEVKATIVPKYQQKMRDAFSLEKKLQRGVKKGKNKEELSELINKISQLKKEALQIRLDALNQIQKIVTKEQWQKIFNLTYK